MQIKKWNVYLADLNPRFGTEPGKLRPVVVIQTNFLNDASHPSTIICPTTTKVIPGARILRIHLKKGQASLHEDSDILVDQIRAIDNRRFKESLGELHKETRIRLRECLRILFDLD